MDEVVDLDLILSIVLDLEYVDLFLRLSFTQTMYDRKIEQGDECGFGLYQGLAKSIEISFPRKKNQDKNIVTAQILQALNLFDTWIKSLSHEYMCQSSFGLSAVWANRIFPLNRPKGIIFWFLSWGLKAENLGSSWECKV